MSDPDLSLDVSGDGSTDGFTDGEVLRALGVSFEDRLPPIPDSVRDLARQAIRWRTATDLLAELLSDSASEDGARQLEGAVRSTTSARRSVRFGTGPVQLELSIGESETVVSLHPPLELTCLVESPAGNHQLVTAAGQGEFAHPRGAPLRLKVVTPEGTFVTPWVTGLTD